MTLGDALSLLDAGAAVALAVLVWHELRLARAALVVEAQATRAELADLNAGQAVLLDRVTGGQA